MQRTVLREWGPRGGMDGDRTVRVEMTHGDGLFWSDYQP